MLVKCLGEAPWLKRAWVRGLDELWFTGPASTRRLEGRNASWTASVEARLLSPVPARAHQPKILAAQLEVLNSGNRPPAVAKMVSRATAGGSSPRHHQPAGLMLPMPASVLPGDDCDFPQGSNRSLRTEVSVAGKRNFQGGDKATETAVKIQRRPLQRQNLAKQPRPFGDNRRASLVGLRAAFTRLPSPMGSRANLSCLPNLNGTDRGQHREAAGIGETAAVLNCWRVVDKGTTRIAC
jgi:hypothetical protein